MRIIEVDPENPDPAAIAEAASILRAGRLVAFPTETVYGLGGNALDSVALERIFAAKGRPAFNPLIAHCFDVQGAIELAAAWPPEADRLARAFWPGPLTLVLCKRSSVPDRLTAGLATVALRVPSHPVALALLRAAAFPIAAPSANRFTELSPTTATHVAKGLGERVDLVLDAGPTAIGIESTVVDLSGPEPVLLRPGSIPLGRIEAVLDREVRMAGDVSGFEPRSAPGMTERHYSPRAPLVLVPSGEARPLAERADEAARQGALVGALLRSSPRTAAISHPIVMPDDPASFARDLYAALHRLDEAGCDLILVEEVPSDPEWAGVRDRLSRARHGPQS